MIWNIINLGQTQREINSYSSKLTHSEDDISATTFQLILQKTMEIKTLKLEKNMYLKKYQNKYKKLSIWSIKVLSELRSNHAWEIDNHTS